MDEPNSQTTALEGALERFPPKARIAEMRATVRYSLRAKVVFTWCDSQGTAREEQGYTRNISQRGAYVIAARSPGKGDRVMLSFFLPALAGESRELRIDAAGKVLRVETATEREAPMGFAVSNESINLCAA